MNRQITLIAIAVFFSSILLFQSFVIQSYAQTFQVVTGFAQPIKAMHYQPETDSIWVIAEGSGFSWLYQIDRSTQSVIFSYNHTKTLDDLSAGAMQDIWCGKTDCYITTATTDITFNGMILRIPTQNISPNIFKGVNVTGTYTSPQSGLYSITGRDQVSGGFGSVTMWVDGCTTEVTTCNPQVYIVDGISMLSPGNFGVYTTSSARVHDMVWSGISGTIDNDLIVTRGFITDTGAQDRLDVYNLATGTSKCGVSVGGVGENPLGVASLYFGAGDANNKIYVGSIDGKLYVYNDTCTQQQLIATGLTGDLRYVDVANGRIFVQETGANALIKQFLLNSTGHVTSTNSTYFPLPSTSQSSFDSVFTTVPVGNDILFSGFGKYWFTYTGTDKKVGILTYDASLGGVGGDFCDDPANANILICRVGGNGEIGSAGAFVIGNTTQGTGILGLGCSIGLVDCTEDENPQTNGLGLLIFIASIFVIVGMFYRSLGASATFQMPIFIWVIIIVALSAFFTITGLIDPIFLILSIVAVIALASPKVIGLIQNRGGGFGGGGSTE